ncbi:MAG: threonylcarbamoyl-AMP synthase [Lachnospiraceae bacterium]|nr:threonylcarbamoyl-AMP synthase [Lachnospiraceae bacterium]
METRWVKLRQVQTPSSVICEAGEIIRRGGLVAFPTETVYGLGGDALNPESSAKIYQAKGRPSDNPLIVHICCMEDLAPIVKEIPPSAKILADAFWPGPLTMIFQKSVRVPCETTGGLDTVAVRFPRNETALALIREAGGYIAAPSANTSGRPSPTEGKYVYEDLSGRIEMILDDGLADIGLESTIVDMTEEIPVILRPGYITEEMIEKVLGKVNADPTLLSVAANVAPKAPGMKYKHYAPKGDLTIVAGSQGDVVTRINNLAREARTQGKKVGVIGTDETISFYRTQVRKSVGSRVDEASIARRLYQILREFDDEKVDVIYSESFDDTGIGQAIMNRLLKAAGHNVLHVEDEQI